MKHEVKAFRLTLPKEVRGLADIPKDGFVDISYDENLKGIVIRNLENLEAYNSEAEKSSKVVKNISSEPINKELDIHKKEIPNVPDKVKDNIEIKPTKAPVKRSQSAKNKIVANFEDAPNLYKAYFSECGLVVRTKTRYVNSFCEKCKGQLAREWEDKAEVKCRYLDTYNDISSKSDNKTEVNKEDITENQNKDTSSKSIDIESMKVQRRNDIEQITKSISKAKKIISDKIESLNKDTNSQAKDKRYSNDHTVLKPIKLDKDSIRSCDNCGEYQSKGFMIDDRFLCKECTKKDFKEYLKRRGI